MIYIFFIFKVLLAILDKRGKISEKKDYSEVTRMALMTDFKVKGDRRR